MTSILPTCPDRIRAALLGAALGVTLGACGEQIEVDNARPEVTVDGWCTADGRTYLLVTVRDLESDPVDLSICTGGGALGTGPTGDGLVGLSSDPQGRPHHIEWAGDAETCICGASPEGGAACAEPPMGDRAAQLDSVWSGDAENPLQPGDTQTADALGPCP